MYLTTDQPNHDHETVVAIGEDGDSIRLFDYVLIDFRSEQWIGQVIAPNLNISTSGSPFDPSILYAIKVSQQNANVQMAQTVEAWTIRLSGEYEHDKLRTLRRRPKPGAVVTRLDRQTTIRVLHLPDLKQDDNARESNVIGSLLNAEDVPLCIDHNILTHHILVSGGTGSGKSNVGANLIHQASLLGFTVFLYDAKPDYRKMSLPNTDPSVADVWKTFERYHVRPMSPKRLIKMAIYGVGTAGRTKDYKAYDKVIGFRASDFDPYLLAGIFFDPQANINQYEEMASVCNYLKYRNDDPEKTIFSMKAVLDEIHKRWKAGLEREKSKSDPDPNERVIHPLTAQAMVTKIGRIKDQLKWLDAVDAKVTTSGGESDSLFDRGQAVVESFRPEDFIKMEGSIVHIDFKGIDTRTYALFLARLMELNQKHLSEHSGKVFELVDEAHRLFTNNTPRYSEMMGQEFSRVMVEGRSLGHAVGLSLQNASQVPILILNNVNSHIVLKQNNLIVAKAATQTMGDNFAERSLALSQGHALSRLFESSMTVLAQMAPSPFELERTDNASI